jgi:hypothetical protein
MKIHVTEPTPYAARAGQDRHRSVVTVRSATPDELATCDAAVAREPWARRLSDTSWAVETPVEAPVGGATSRDAVVLVCRELVEAFVPLSRGGSSFDAMVR